MLLVFENNPKYSSVLEKTSIFEKIIDVKTIQFIGTIRERKKLIKTCLYCKNYDLRRITNTYYVLCAILYLTKGGNW